jgi:hypothetical protein
LVAQLATFTCKLVAPLTASAFHLVALLAASTFKLVALLATFALGFKSVAIRTSHTHAIKFTTVFTFDTLAFKSFGFAP